MILCLTGSSVLLFARDIMCEVNVDLGGEEARSISSAGEGNISCESSSKRGTDVRDDKWRYGDMALRYVCSTGVDKTWIDMLAATILVPPLHAILGLRNEKCA